MIDPGIPPLIDDMAGRLHAHFGVKPSTLQAQMKSIGRQMPARMRGHLRVLMLAEQVMDHPKLSRRANLAQVQTAHAELLPYLKTVDLTDKRKGVALGILGSIAFNLLLFLAIVLAILHWQGVI